ncbi:hypothetical protein HN014_08145 [Aquimarina sp. TRL1]|uniref:hypothetical protein n=1 Tax=Aquimarina sp. (strain TRL1) TaxID=2736252 RepID=UPI001589CC0B|nr:hypothetical protein [Aquimarina sp. TRL1]QKX04889.1 hypothetical protein HN014_08145 [Aquimarina sp. TRL1]
MSKDKELQQAFKGIFPSQEQIFSATVMSVNKEEKTITALDTDQMEYSDVRLSAAIDNKTNKVISFPSVGSTVLLGKISGDDNTLFVCAANEIESIEGNISGVNFLIDQSGYKINANQESLKRVMNDLIDEINKIIVIQGTSINVPAMNAIKQRLNNLLT